MAGRRVLVVGAGPVGRRRVAMAVEAGAEVRWVAPDAPSTPRVDVRPRRWRADDLSGCALAFTCASPAVNAAVVAAGRAAGVFVGRADAPDEGDLRVPARLRRGALLIGLSTGGRVPAAASALRRALAERVPESWGIFVAQLAAARATKQPGPARRAWVRRLADGPLLGLLESGDLAAAGRLLASIDETDRWS